MGCDGLTVNDGKQVMETKIYKEKTKQMNYNMFLQINKMHINDRRLS